MSKQNHFLNSFLKQFHHEEQSFSDINFDEIASILNECIWIFDRQKLSFLFINQKIESIYEISKMGIQMNPNFWLDVVYSEDLPIIENASKELLISGEYDLKYRIKVQNKIKWIRDKKKLIKNEKNEPNWVMSLVSDISDEISKDVEYNNLEVFFENFIQNSHDSIIIYNRETRVIFYTNLSAQKIYGYSEIEFQGMSLDNLVPIDEKENNIPSYENLLKHLAKNKNELYVDVVSIDVKYKNVNGCLLIIKNLTELIKKQNEIIKLNSYLKSQNDYLREISFLNSHKVRGPLASILTLLQNIPSEDLTNSEYIKNLNISANNLDSAILEISNALNKVDFKEFYYTKNKIYNKIFIVDDDLIQCKLTKSLIEKINPEKTVEYYSNPLEAIERIESLKILPDLILLDINMPEMNAWEFLDKLKEIKIDITVCIISSSTDNEDIRISKTYSNVIGFFTKPITRDKLTNILHSS